MKKKIDIQVRNKILLFWNLRLFALLSILFLGLPLSTVSARPRNVNNEYTYWKKVGEHFHPKEYARPGVDRSFSWNLGTNIM
ncbi:MAG: hypothetical protein D3909_18995 [Candidatus Electrothrix sp. ATG1]|nr:hypothetical protein [Candidatus Electrothrix sp. ATG1]